MHPSHRVGRPASSLALRPFEDVRNIMRVEEAKRIDERPSSTVPFSTWLIDIKIHMMYHGTDSVVYVLVPQARTPAIVLADINDHPHTLSDFVKWNLFTDWGSILQEQIVAFDAFVKTSNCEVDRQNDTFARKFLRDSVGSNLRASIDWDLPLDCSGARMLYFIIRKLQIVSATSGQNMVDKIKAMRLTSEPASNAQDFGTKLQNLCFKLEGLGAKYVPDDLPMLLACCYDTTRVTSFDLEVIQVQNALDEDPTKYTWQDVIVRFGKKFDILVGNERWRPLKNAGKATETGFSVYLKDATSEMSALQSRIATLTQALTAAQGHGTPAMSTNVECNYCHEHGHVVATCPKLAAKRAKEAASQEGSSQVSLGGGHETLDQGASSGG
jgi:hypothetical protein